MEEQTTLKDALSLWFKVIEADQLFKQAYYSENYLNRIFKALLLIKMPSGWRADLLDHLFSLSLMDRPSHPIHEGSTILRGAILQYPLLLKYSVLKLTIKDEAAPTLRIISCLCELAKRN